MEMAFTLWPQAGYFLPVSLSWENRSLTRTIQSFSAVRFNIFSLNLGLRKVQYSPLRATSEQDSGNPSLDQP